MIIDIKKLNNIINTFKVSYNGKEIKQINNPQLAIKLYMLNSDDIIKYYEYCLLSIMLDALIKYTL